MPVPAGDPALHRPGIRTRAQHQVVVVGFEDQQVTDPESVTHRERRSAHIRGDPYLQAAGPLAHRHGHRIDGVVAGQKRLDAQVT